jgi:hypothetical protein
MTPGTRIGIYEIVDKIGEGGMGEGIARDTRLDRQVALKVLPALFTSDAERSRASSVKRRCSRRSTIRTSRRSTGSSSPPSRWSS